MELAIPNGPWCWDTVALGYTALVGGACKAIQEHQLQGSGGGEAGAIVQGRRTRTQKKQYR